MKQGVHRSGKIAAKLCTRADREFRPETLITVFSDHFPLSTQNAEHEAHLAVSNFKANFQNVAYLTPLGFFDIQGNRQCYHMTKKTRPPNVCYLNEKAEIPLSEFTPKFQGKTCRLEYYLHLPQSNNYTDMEISMSDTTSDMKNNPSFIFDDDEQPTKELSSIFDDEADENSKNSSKKSSTKRNLENPVTPPASKRSHMRFIEDDQGAIK